MSVDESRPLESIMDSVDDAVQGSPTDLKDIVGSFGDRAFGPILSLCGLFLITPIGVIPGIPIAMCVIIISFALQIILGRKHPWLPEGLRRVKVKPAQVKKTKKAVAPWLRRLDGLIRPRMGWAATPKAVYMSAILSIILAVSLLPLGAIPFGVVIPGVIICLLGLGLMARDGLLILIGFTLAGLASALISSLVF